MTDQESKFSKHLSKAQDKPDSAHPRWIHTTALVGIFALILTVLARYIIEAPYRVMEFDQICTLITASSHTWAEYLKAVPIDSQPPLSHLAARIGMSLPLPQGLGVRLFSAAATASTAVCMYLLFARRRAPLAGLCAASFFCASRAAEFMFSVRPYSMLMAVTALCTLVYDEYRRQRIARGLSPVWPLTGMLLLASSVHILALIYTTLIILFGELLYQRQSRVFDRRIALAFLLAAPGFGLDLALTHLVTSSYTGIVPLSAKVVGFPTIEKFRESLLFPVERSWQIVLLLSVIAAALALRKHTDAESSFGTSSELDSVFPFVAAIAIYSGVVVSFAVGMLNHYYFSRYASPAFVAGSLLLGGLLSGRGWRRVLPGQIAIAVVLLAMQWIAIARFLKDSNSHNLPEARMEELARRGTFVASPLVAPTLWWYLPAASSANMLVLTDSAKWQTLADGIPEATLRRFEEDHLLPFRLTPFKTYHFPDTVIMVTATPGADTWVPLALSSNGYSCKIQTQDQGLGLSSQTCIKLHHGF